MSLPTEQELRTIPIPTLAKRYRLSPSYLYRLKKGAYKRKTPLPLTKP